MKKIRNAIYDKKITMRALKSNSNRNKNRHRRARKMEKELDTALAIMTMGLVAVMLFSSIAVGSLFDESLDFELAYSNNNVDLIDNDLKGVTGLAVSDFSSDNPESSDNTDYKVKFRHNLGFSININEINYLDDVKKDIAVMINKVKSCRRSGVDTRDCVEEYAKENFDTDCDLNKGVRNDNLINVADQFEYCKDAVSVSADQCYCSFDFSILDDENLYVFNLKKDKSIVLYDYDEDLIEDSKAKEKKISEIKNSLGRTIIIDDFELSSYDSVDFIRIDEGYIGAEIELSNNRKFEFDSDENVMILKDNNTLYIIPEEEIEDMIVNSNLEECIVEDSLIYDFCTKEKFEFNTNYGVKETRIGFSVDFS